MKGGGKIFSNLIWEKLPRQRERKDEEGLGPAGRPGRFEARS
jgi:hypothetical protein